MFVTEHNSTMKTKVWNKVVDEIKAGVKHYPSFEYFMEL